MTARSELNIQGARFYPFDSIRDESGRPLWVPSVTSILHVWPKPALTGWAAKSEKAGILDDLETWLREDAPTGLATRGAAIDRVLAMREAPLRYLEVGRKARDIGSSAHEWLEWFLRKEMKIHAGPEPALLPGAEKCVKGAMEWMIGVNLKPIAVEQRVLNREYNYAGRYDLKAEVDWKEGFTTERRIVIVDWKSSKGIYDDMLVQNHAYRGADATMANGSRSHGGIVVRLAKTADDPIPFEARQVPFSS